MGVEAHFVKYKRMTHPIHGADEPCRMCKQEKWIPGLYRYRLFKLRMRSRYGRFLRIWRWIWNYGETPPWQE